MITAAERTNADQAEFWNSAPGRKWLRYEDMLDTLLDGVARQLLARADPRSGERVIDIGCGTGATTRALAERVGAEGRVLAVDISAPLLDRARERFAGLPQSAFLLADAQVHPLGQADADLAVSRFGVMFFDDPVAAFRNIRAALRPGGRLCFVAWAPLAENPWFAIPRRAAIDRLGEPAPQPATAPGPMAFADRARVRGILESAGFAHVEAEPESIDLVWPGEIEPLAALATHLGPAARILREREGTEADEAAIAKAIAADLSRFSGPDGVRVPAVLNMVVARAP